MNITPKPVKVFTREDPVTKVTLHNCFYRGGVYVPRAVVEARGEIGLNAIKYLKKNYLALQEERGTHEYWILTRLGEEWLTEGLARHLELHPGDRVKLNGQATMPTNRKRRTKPH